jgi:leader peptidase (prepilin peptidase)/N-methyltransferase
VDTIGWAIYLGVLGVFGLVFGSFGNVVIWRLPRGESLNSPPSHCPVCDTPIRYRDNIPIVSWLLLGGQCRECGARISARYPLIELLSGGLFVLAGALYGLTWQAIVAAFFFYVLLLLTAIDIDTMRLPNRLVLILFVGGVTLAVAGSLLDVPLVPLIQDEDGLLATPVAAAALGAAIGALVSLGIALAYSAVRGKQGLGFGDVKLLGAMGLYLGPYVLMAFFLGSLIGAVWGIASSRRAGEGVAHRIPFGPFLALGGVLTVVVGPSLWSAYLSVLNVT